METEEGPTGKQATAELMSHICQKGFQAGSLLGLGIILPAMALRRRFAAVSLVSKDFQTMSAKVMTYSPALGMLTTGTTCPPMRMDCSV